MLEEAGLVVARRSGREKLHFLNPVPIRLIHDRWIDKYTERRMAALLAGDRESEGAGGGWNEVLSGLKTLLETGAPLHSG
jgi:hypothetical protein